jgi:alginate O-acetyltransferase complex protein AlgI
MLFPTAVFAIFFLVVFVTHWTLAGWPRIQKVALLCASLFFYGYWSWKFALMLLASALFNHAVARHIHGLAPENGRRKRHGLVLALVFNLGMLGFWKYTGFFVGDILLPVLRWCSIRIGPESVQWLIGFQEELFPVMSRIVLPVGISFFTFQALSYVIDVYYGKTAPARSWLDFANYLAFFSQLVAGPIVRAVDLVPQMERMPQRDTPIDVGRAAFLILVGLFKKTVVANWLASNLADPVFAWPSSFSGPDALLGVYGYAIQIYCDFSAYSDIAIGTALLLGLHFPDNFNAPYFATSLQDFWRRWHISLSSWLRDYLYIPLGGSRKGTTRTGANLLLTFLLGGLWHGAAWTFILWGAFHGAYLILERAMMAAWNTWIAQKPVLARLPVPAAICLQKAGRFLARVWIFHVVCFSWILFRAGEVHIMQEMFGSILSWRSQVTTHALWEKTAMLMFIIGFMTQLCDGQRLWGLCARLSRLPGWVLGILAAAILTFILALGPEGVAPFIYFQF